MLCVRLSRARSLTIELHLVLKGHPMSYRLMRRSLALAIFVVVSCSVARAADPLRYELRFERPNTHLMDVTIHAGDLKGPRVEFAMPDWAPGSYSLQNYARMCRDFARSALTARN